MIREIRQGIQHLLPRVHPEDDLGAIGTAFRPLETAEATAYRPLDTAAAIALRPLETAVATALCPLALPTSFQVYRV